MSLVPRVGRADMDAVQTWVVCGKTEGWGGNLERRVLVGGSLTKCKLSVGEKNKAKC